MGKGRILRDDIAAIITHDGAEHAQMPGPYRPVRV